MSSLTLEYKKLLAIFLKFKSISTDTAYSTELNKTSEWLAKLFEMHGFDTKVWRSEKANPVVFASYQLPQNTKKHHTQNTILVYGHYDVQPASKNDGWKYEPFTLSENHKKLFGRGVIDNKGQVLVHIVTVLDLIKKGKLNSNVKFIIEGNEETGNDSLGSLIKKHKKLLNCDYVLISDGELTNNKPTIETSLRGGFNCSLKFKTGKSNLHSGIWGGVVPNAAHELSKFISKLYDKNNTISFRGFYTGLDKPTRLTLANNKLLEKSAHSLTKLSGVKQLVKEKGYDFFTATGLRPTIQVSGIKSGYIDSGFANIVPNEAEVKLNFRIAPSQKSEVIMNTFSKFVKRHTPKYVEYTLTYNNPHEPVKVSTSSNFVKNIEGLLQEVYGSKVNRRNVGGAIPFVSDVKKVLGVDAVLVPLVNEDCNMHGVNENFEKKYLHKALEFSSRLFSKQ